MVEPNVYGIWEKENSSLYRKETDNAILILEAIPQENEVYCFIEQGGTMREYHIVTESTIEICEEIMKRESHNEEFIEVVKEFNSTRIN